MSSVDHQASGNGHRRIEPLQSLATLQPQVRRMFAIAACPYRAIVRTGFRWLFAPIVGCALAVAVHAQEAVVGSARAKGAAVLVPGLQPEGPHVFLTDQGYTVMRTEQQSGAWHVVTEELPAKPMPRITVQVDNETNTAFDVELRAKPKPAISDIPDNPERLLMLSDMEGQFDKFVALLRANGVLDATLHWRYGPGHIVLVGDLVDRGEHSTALLWLIYRLDAEATAAGGALHYVLGNHEQMLLSGRSKYWAPRQVAFAKALGAEGERKLYGAASVLGAWLASKPVIARVGDHLFVHGGISQAFMSRSLTIAEANRIARPYLFTELQVLPADAAAVIGELGVTWYRGMALPDDPMFVRESDPKSHLESVLAHYDVKRLAIGHTIVPNVGPEQSGRLLRLDIHHAEQLPEAVLFEQGMVWKVDAAGSRTPLLSEARSIH